MNKSIYEKLQVEFVQLLGKVELEEAQDFWQEKLDYLIDNGNCEEVRKAENLLDEIAYCIAVYKRALDTMKNAPVAGKQN